MSPIVIVVGFLLSATAVVFAGVRLARHGDVIAARTRLGGVWVGTVFLAFATSLPELATDIAAIRLGAPNLAAGDLFGSSMSNMLILALASLLPGADLFRRAALDNGLSASLAITLMAMAALFLVTRLDVAWFGVGLGSILIAGGYLAGVRTVFQHSVIARAAGTVEEMAGEAPAAETPAESGEQSPLRRAIAGFIVACLIVLVTAPLFAASAEGLAELTGLGTSFTGTWLVGFATSLPELVTSIAAVRMRAYDLAVGNLFGSNALNMAMFLPLDIAHGGTPILGVVSGVHILSALVGIAMMAIGIAAITYRAKARRAALEPSALLMISVYILGLGLIYAYRATP